MALKSCFVLIVLCLTVCTSISAKTISQSTLEKVMELSGINDQAAQLPAVIWAGVLQAQSRQPLLAPPELSEAEQHIKKAFDITFILSVVRDEVRGDLSEEAAQEVLVWLESDLGKKITEHEKRASTPQAVAEMMSLARAHLADTERVERFKKYDSLVNAVGSTMQIQQKAAIASFAAIANAISPDPQAQIASYKSQIYAQENIMRANAEQIAAISFVHGYKDLPLAEIDKYLEFNSKRSSLTYSKAIQRGMRKSMNQGLEKMSQSMAQMFKKYHGQKSK